MEHNNSTDTKPDMSAMHDELFAQGLATRRAVLGDTYVDRTLQNGSTEYAKPLQSLIIEWAWGSVWTRPGLDRKQRSLLNLGMLTALKAWPELAVHTRGAINNGLSELEIREAILQTSVYIGAPAAIEAMKVTEKALNDMAADGEHTRQLT